MQTGYLKVGRLARRTGLTVRTLHHYEAVGLLVPSRRTRSGHRLYDSEDVARLQQIVALRQLGLSLEEIGGCLDAPGFSMREVLARRLAHLEAQMQRQERLRRTLSGLLERLDAGASPSVDELLLTIEEMTMYEKYYTPEQLEQLERRAQEVGPERIAQVQQEWPRLIAEVKAEMARGTDPTSPSMQRLAARWQALVDEFTGGDPGIRASLAEMYRREGSAAASHGHVDADVMAYVRRAMGDDAGTQS